MKDFEIIESEVRAFLKADEMKDMLKDVAETIMAKDGLDSPTYSYHDAGTYNNRRVGYITRDDEDGYFKDMQDGKLRKAARSRLGDITK